MGHEGRTPGCFASGCRSYVTRNHGPPATAGRLFCTGRSPVTAADHRLKAADPWLNVAFPPAHGSTAHLRTPLHIDSVALEADAPASAPYCRREETSDESSGTRAQERRVDHAPRGAAEYLNVGVDIIYDG